MGAKAELERVYQTIDKYIKFYTDVAMDYDTRMLNKLEKLSRIRLLIEIKGGTEDDYLKVRSMVIDKAKQDGFLKYEPHIFTTDGEPIEGGLDCDRDT